MSIPFDLIPNVTKEAFDGAIAGLTSLDETELEQRRQAHNSSGESDLLRLITAATGELIDMAQRAEDDITGKTLPLTFDNFPRGSEDVPYSLSIAAGASWGALSRLRVPVVGLQRDKANPESFVLVDSSAFWGECSVEPVARVFSRSFENLHDYIKTLGLRGCPPSLSLRFDSTDKEQLQGLLNLASEEEEERHLLEEQVASMNVKAGDISQNGLIPFCRWLDNA